MRGMCNPIPDIPIISVYELHRKVIDKQNVIYRSVRIVPVMRDVIGNSVNSYVGCIEVIAGNEPHMFFLIGVVLLQFS